MGATRTFLSAAFFIAALTLVGPATAAAGSAAHDGPTVDAHAMLQSGLMLRAIDSAFEAGALTFQEAQALYSEQSAIRTAYIETVHERGAAAADARVSFMVRTAWATLARLSFNHIRRVDVAFRVADFR